MNGPCFTFTALAKSGSKHREIEPAENQKRESGVEHEESVEVSFRVGIAECVFPQQSHTYMIDSMRSR